MSIKCFLYLKYIQLTFEQPVFEQCGSTYLQRIFFFNKYSKLFSLLMILTFSFLSLLYCKNIVCNTYAYRMCSSAVSVIGSALVNNG